jgi:hypothetical protein
MSGLFSYADFAGKVAFDQILGGGEKVIGKVVFIKPLPAFPILGKQHFRPSINFGGHSNTDVVVSERIIGVNGDDSVTRDAAIKFLFDVALDGVADFFAESNISARDAVNLSVLVGPLFSQEAEENLIVAQNQDVDINSGFLIHGIYCSRPVCGLAKQAKLTYE